MGMTDRFGLKENPFRATPAALAEELVWAGFHGIEKRLSDRIARSARIPNSSLVLNWGEYGSGKTHAARYFSKRSVLEGLAAKAHVAVPYSIVLNLPKGRESVAGIYTSVIDKIDFGQLKADVSASGLDYAAFIDRITTNLHIRSVLKAILGQQVSDIGLLRAYLYGNAKAAEMGALRDAGILRGLSSDTDYTQLLSGLFSCLTYERKLCSCVVLWIDEFEDIAGLTSSNIQRTNDFLRELLDNTPNGLLIFINLTQTTLFGPEDLSQYLTDAVRSRIKETNNLELPKTHEIKEYLTELLKYFEATARDAANPLAPFKEDVVDEVIKDLGGVSLRPINEAFSLLLELADMEEVSPITLDFYSRHKGEVTGWRRN